MTDVNSTASRERVIIFDTTLRDGEQCPGAAMTFEQKVKIAEMLDAMGVDVIETGFANSSDTAFASMQAIAPRMQRATVCGLARATREDILSVARALRGAEKWRIHTFLSTSPIHREMKLRMNRAQVVESTSTHVALAKSLTDDVEWSAEDATRTEPEFLAECVEAAIAAGATTINLPDTVGYASLGSNGVGEVFNMFDYMMKHVRGARNVVFSTHCHNDLGMAVSNSIQGVLGGARQVECTINGLGERAGNASLEEVVMALAVRHPQFYTGIDTTKLMQASRLVAQASGFPVQYNKAIVGRNAFAHESGIHQDGMLKSSQTYEIMSPEMVGQTGSKLVLGRHSGRKALQDAYKKMGYNLGDNVISDLFPRFKKMADMKKEVTLDDLLVLYGEVTHVHDRLQLENMSINMDDKRREVHVFMKVDGMPRNASSRKGNGPVDMVMHAIAKVAKIKDFRLLEYRVEALNEGSDAQADTHVRVAYQGKEYSGVASNPDTVMAAGLAFVRALNKIKPE